MLLNVDDLVKKEKKEGMNTIIFAYDDLDYALEFYVKCLKEEIKPIIGQKITIGGQEVVLLCKDSEGYRILCRHSADSERTFTKEESSHFIFTTLKDCNNFEEQIPYIFPKDYFSKENLYKRQIDNLPDIPFPAGIGSAAEYLTCLVNNGVKYRYETPSPKVQMRVKQELIVLNPVQAMHGDLGMTAPRDMLVALSFSGESDEVVKLVPAIRRHGLKIVALTGNPDSALARMSDITLPIPCGEEACC